MELAVVFAISSNMAEPLLFNFQIECSSMADMAQEIVKLNGFSDGEKMLSLMYFVTDILVCVLY